MPVIFPRLSATAKKDNLELIAVTLGSQSQNDRYTDTINMFEYGFDKHWIQPTWFGNGGLKSEHVIQAINIMNNKYKEVN